jgi:hypothetical protein
LYQFIENQNGAIDKLESAELVNKEKEDLLLKVCQLEDELEGAQGRGNELMIKNEPKGELRPGANTFYKATSLSRSCLRKNCRGGQGLRQSQESLLHTRLGVLQAAAQEPRVRDRAEQGQKVRQS